MSTSKDDKIPGWLAGPMSIISWLLVAFFTVTTFLFGLVTLLPLSLIFSFKSRYFLHMVAVLWGKVIIVTSPLWKIKVTGAEFIDPKKRYVIIANHQSMLDILVCLAGIPKHFKFLAKKSLFYIPVIGWQMALAGYIALDRDSKDSGRRAILRARRWLNQGVSVLFYPEGTRSVDGKIKNFKMGAFKIAAEDGYEILPVIIDGTGDFVPKNSWKLQKLATFRVSIGKPIQVRTETAEELVNLKEKIRQEMIARLEQIRK